MFGGQRMTNKLNSAYRYYTYEPEQLRFGNTFNEPVRQASAKVLAKREDRKKYMAAPQELNRTPYSTVAITADEDTMKSLNSVFQKVTDEDVERRMKLQRMKNARWKAGLPASIHVERMMVEASNLANAGVGAFSERPPHRRKHRHPPCGHARHSSMAETVGNSTCHISEGARGIGQTSGRGETTKKIGPQSPMSPMPPASARETGYRSDSGIHVGRRRAMSASATKARARQTCHHPQPQPPRPDPNPTTGVWSNACPYPPSERRHRHAASHVDDRGDPSTSSREGQVGRGGRPAAKEAWGTQGQHMPASGRVTERGRRGAHRTGKTRKKQHTAEDRLTRALLRDVDQVYGSKNHIEGYTGHRLGKHCQEKVRYAPSAEGVMDMRNLSLLIAHNNVGAYTMPHKTRSVKSKFKAPPDPDAHTKTRRKDRILGYGTFEDYLKRSIVLDIDLRAVGHPK
eukprot:Rmarinus@m.11873